MSDRPIPNVPKDELLAHLLHNFPSIVYKYHEHDSLLENKAEQDLSEEEKADAWRAYENDVQKKNESINQFGNMNAMGNNYGMSNLSSYANLYNNYGMGGVTNPLGSYQNMYNNPFVSDYNQMRLYNDYSSFYNTLMGNPNYNLTNSPLLSPSHSPGATSPMLNFNSARNWLGNSSTSAFNNSLLQSMGQSSTSSSSKNNYNNTSAYNRSLYGAAFVAPNALLSPNSASSSKSPPTTAAAAPYDLSTLAYLQSHLAGTNTTSTSTLQSALLNATANQSAQGPNAIRNPITNSLLSKELSIPTRSPNFDAFGTSLLPSIPTSVITKSTTNSNSATTTSTVTTTAKNLSKNSAINLANKTVNANDGGKNPNDSLLIQKSTVSNGNDAHITIKDVSAINESVRKSPEAMSNASKSANANSLLHKNKENENNVSSTNKATNIEKTTINIVSAAMPGPSSSSNAATSNSPHDLRNKVNSNTATNLTVQKANVGNTSKGSGVRTSTPVNSNMGIVYPPPKKTSTNPSSVSTTVTNSRKSPQLAINMVNKGMLLINIRFIANYFYCKIHFCIPIKIAGDKDPAKHQMAVSSTNLNSKNQPMASIIRKPQFPNPSSVADAGAAVINTLSKNKALTVTQKTAGQANSPMVQIPKINNSITVSPIPNTSNSTAMKIKPLPQALAATKPNSSKPTSQSPTTPNRTRMSIGRPSNAIVPISLSKAPPTTPANLNKASSSSPSPISITPVNPIQTNVRNSNINAPPKTVTSSSVLNASRVVSNSAPKVLVQTRTSPIGPTSKIMPKPIIIQPATPAQLKLANKTHPTPKPISPVIVGNRIYPPQKVIQASQSSQAKTAVNISATMHSRKRSAQPNNKTHGLAKKSKLQLDNAPPISVC